LRNFLSQFNERENDNIIHYGSGKGDLNANDFIKFDRINLFDFRRMLPTKERSDNIDKNARAWGYGKRKASRALVNVKPGTGKVTINGKPMHLYFHLPSQRYRMLKPLIATGYTALLDVNVHVHGGGFTGQCEACIPALAKAVQRFDVNTRPTLKSMGLLKTDPRVVERKKIGLPKARKGPTYVRR
jgi:small subunit ribosomal protein S9